MGRLLAISAVLVLAVGCPGSLADRPGDEGDSDTGNGREPPGLVEGRWVQRVPDFELVHPTLVFDPVRNATIALSLTLDPTSSTNTFLGTLWALEDDGWRFVSDLPSSVEDAAIAWDDARQVLLVVLRTENPVRLMETWTLSGTTWTRVANQGPEARLGFRLIADPGTSDVILAGGDAFGPATGAWAWDGTRWVPRTEDEPGGEQDLALVADDVGVLAITARGTIHRLSSTSWIDVGTAPVSDFAAAAFDPQLGRVLIFTPTSVVAWDVASGESSPPVDLDVRVLAAGHDPTTRVVRALGLDEDGQWVVDLGATVERWQFGIRALTAMAGTFDENLDAVLLYGGTPDGDGSPDQHVGAVWSWDGERFSPQPVGPPASSSATMAFDRSSRRTLLLTGRGGQRPQTWEFDGASWIERFPAFGPETSGDAAMVWVAAEGRILLVHGAGRDATSWWTGTDWDPGPPLPAGVERPILAEDQSGSILLVGQSGVAFRFSEGAWVDDDTIMPGTPSTGPDSVLLVEVREGTTTSGWTAAGGLVPGVTSPTVVPDRALGVWDAARRRLWLFGGVRYRPAAEPAAEVWEWEP